MSGVRLCLVVLQVRALRLDFVLALIRLAVMAVDAGRVADLSDSGDEVPPGQRTPQRTPQRPSGGGVVSPKAKGSPKPKVSPKKATAKGKGKAKGMKKPAATKRPASAMDVNGDESETAAPAPPLESETPPAAVEDPPALKKPAGRKVQKSADHGLEPITHVKHQGEDYFNMRYVSKGKVSIKVQETKKVVFTVSRHVWKVSSNF